MKHVEQTCPSCGAVGSLSLDMQLVAKPVGSFSLAGNAVKVSAQMLPVLYCIEEGCGWTKTGRVEDGYAVFDNE